MKYFSTRNKEVLLESCDVIKRGISAEGGLFWPENFPQVSLDEIVSLSALGYRERAKFVLSKFLTDFSQEEIDFL